MSKDRQLVAIAYDLNFRHAAEIFSGVSDYVQKWGFSWQLLPLNFGFEAKLMELAASGHLSGAIGTFVSDEWVGGLERYNIATVNLFNFSKIVRAPTVALDDAAIGKSAAKHLLEQGANALTFIGQDEAYFNRIRREHFIKACPAGAYQAIHALQPRKFQAESLRNVKGPVGVLCANDRIARELCNEAALLDMKVGKELLIVGIGNDPTESTFAGVGLSSFDIPARRIGFLAAKQMEKLLHPESQVTLPALERNITATLIRRESTLPSAESRLIERANTLIHESLAQPDFDIAALCQILGVSRRVLELATRSHLNKSPYQILSEKRLEYAKERLINTNQTITKVGESCGYPEPHHFSTWFKQRTKLAPRHYRTARRIASREP